MNARKIPPHVMRELKRHLPPPPKEAPTTKQNSNLKYVLAGCIAFTATTASFPILAQWWIGNLNAKEDALTAAQTRRGAFNNSGTKDVGRDQNWDFTKGVYKKKDESGYAAMQNEKQNLPGQFHAASPDKMKGFDEKIEAFAKGRGRNN